MDNQGSSMRIGEVSRLAGVNIQTLRYYERRRLLPEPDRHPSGYREYGPETVRLVRFIKRAQELGFTLREIGELIQLRKNDSRSGTEVRALATAKLQDVERRIHRLGAMRNALRGLIKACACEGASPTCPIIEALDDSAEHLVRAGLVEE